MEEAEQFGADCATIICEILFTIIYEAYSTIIQLFILINHRECRHKKDIANECMV